MTPSTFLVLVPVLFGLVGLPPSARPVEADLQARVEPAEQFDLPPLLIAQSEVVLRIPLRPRVSRPIEWRERKGPKCLNSDEIRGAILSGPTEVDFLMNDRSRIRAKFDASCPALDFYSGFYLSPEDERICAGRDVIRSRMGGNCKIERYYQLVPGRPVP